MTTKPPPATAPFPEDSREKIAYDSVADILTAEPNDRYRLGYHVWRWLSTRQGTLDEAVRESGARLGVPQDEVVRTIRGVLVSRGVDAA